MAHRNSSSDLTIISHTRFDTWTQNGGNIIVDGDISIWVDGDFSQTGGTSTKTPGSSLRIHHGTGILKLAGNGITNTDALPKDLIIDSSTTGAITINGGSNFFGALYAPASALKIGGKAETVGAIVGGTVRLVGGAVLHYDESLAEFRKQYDGLEVRSRQHFARDKSAALLTELISRLP